MTVSLASWGRPEAASGAERETNVRWMFTTDAHFWWYGLLTFSGPIYHDPILYAFLDRDRVYLVIQGQTVNLVALDRQRGNHVWEQRLLSARPIGGMLIKTTPRLIVALFDDIQKRLDIVGMNPADGTILWRRTLLSKLGPSLKEDLVALDTNLKDDTVSVFFLEDKDRKNRVTLRATDGLIVSENNYSGYFWRYGTHQAAGLIFGNDGKRNPGQLIAFQEGTSRVQWKMPQDGHFVSPPTVWNDSLLFVDKERLLKIDVATGKPLWVVNLGGRIFPSDPPLLIDSLILAVVNSTPDSDNPHWKLSIRRLIDGSEEAQVDLSFSQFKIPWQLRRMGDLVIVSAGDVLHIVDYLSKRLVTTLNLQKSYLPFVYADPPTTLMTDSDGQGFVVVSSDGRLRYYSAEDFKGSK